MIYSLGCNDKTLLHPLIKPTLIGLYYLWSYYKFTHLLNCYPEHLKPTVEKIQAYLIDSRKGEKTLEGGFSTIYFFTDIEHWIAKTSKFNFLSECLYSLVEKPKNYAASNEEGTICRPWFSLVSRVIEAKKLRKLIKVNKLFMIKVPKKYLCSRSQIPLLSYLLPYNNDRFFVLAEKCKGNTNPCDSIEELIKLSDQEVKEMADQIVFLLQRSSLLDLHHYNYYFADKKIVFFDTEPMCLAWRSRITLSNSHKSALINLQTILDWLPENNKTAIIKERCKKEMLLIKNKQQILFAKQALLIISLLILSIAIKIFNKGQ